MKYDKYFLCNFGYFDTDGEHRSLVYMGTEENKDNMPCSHCDSTRRKINYLFTEEGTGSELIFGGCCVKKVFGAGLKRAACT